MGITNLFSYLKKFSIFMFVLDLILFLLIMYEIGFEN